MATHKITYETTDKLDMTKLPKGAKVEILSVFPALVTAHRRTLRVNRVADNDMHAATVKVIAENGEFKGLPLTEAQAREIGLALTKAADMAARDRVERDKAAREKAAAKAAQERRTAEARKFAEYLRTPLYRDPYPFRF